MNENDITKMMVFNEMNSNNPIGFARLFIVDEVSDTKLYFEDVDTNRNAGSLRAFGRMFVNDSCHREIVLTSELVDETRWKLNVLKTLNCVKNEIESLQEVARELNDINDDF
jgi:hypothetical protein